VHASACQCGAVPVLRAPDIVFLQPPTPHRDTAFNSVFRRERRVGSGDVLSRLAVQRHPDSSPVSTVGGRSLPERTGHSVRALCSSRLSDSNARAYPTRIERDYQELKTEFGLDKYQGRGWRGFHHHWTLCTAAYAFTVAERSRLFPPQQGPIHPVKIPALPEGDRPRGAPTPSRAP